MQCIAVMCSEVQYNAVQRSAVQRSAVQCSAVQCGAVQCRAVQFSAAQHSAVHENAVMVGSLWYSVWPSSGPCGGSSSLGTLLTFHPAHLYNSPAHRSVQLRPLWRQQHLCVCLVLSSCLYCFGKQMLMCVCLVLSTRSNSLFLLCLEWQF